jgi:hypothetical protein
MQFLRPAMMLKTCDHRVLFGNRISTVCVPGSSSMART